MQKIMFNDKYGLTEAVLNGRKTQTRRIITGVEGLEFYDFGIEGKQYASFINSQDENYQKDINFRYEVGEVVAIAQRYSEINVPVELSGYLKGWNNKMFVRADRMPHHIKITNVRIERLQDISDADCLAEGIIDNSGLYKYTENDKIVKVFLSPKGAYASLIDKVGKKGTWKSNPWVFVYDFELVD